MHRHRAWSRKASPTAGGLQESPFRLLTPKLRRKLRFREGKPSIQGCTAIKSILASYPKSQLPATHPDAGPCASNSLLTRHQTLPNQYPALLGRTPATLSASGYSGTIAWHPGMVTIFIAKGTNLSLQQEGELSMPGSKQTQRKQRSQPRGRHSFPPGGQGASRQRRWGLQ